MGVQVRGHHYTGTKYEGVFEKMFIIYLKK